MSSTDHNGIKTRSRAIITRLNVGDVLRINLPTGYYLYSNNNRITTFTGYPQSRDGNKETDLNFNSTISICTEYRHQLIRLKITVMTLIKRVLR